MDQSARHCGAEPETSGANRNNIIVECFVSADNGCGCMGLKTWGWAHTNFGVPAALGLAEDTLGFEGLFGGGLIDAGDEEDFDNHSGVDDDDAEGAAEQSLADPNNTGSRGRGGRGGRGRGRAGAKAKSKSKQKPAMKSAKSQNERWDVCPLFCKEKVLLLPKQKGCNDCYRDLESMRRDASAAGPKAKQFLRDIEKATNEDDFYELWCQWKRVVGPRDGRPRCGIFKWMKYIEFYEHRAGQRREAVMRQLTKKQFITHFEQKGMSKEWSEKEWDRRLASDDYAKSTDPECGLLTMSAMVHHQFIGFEEFSKGRRLEQGQDMKATKDGMDKMLKQGALTEGAVDCQSADKMRALGQHGLNADVLGQAEATRSTASMDFWADPEGHADAAAGPPAATTPKPAGAADGQGISPGKALTADVFDKDIEPLEAKTSLIAKVNSTSSVLTKPLQKAVQVAAVAKANGGHYADAMKAFDIRIECVQKVLDDSEKGKEAFQTYKKNMLADKSSVFPLGRQAFEELHCVQALLDDVAAIGNVETRAELLRQARDIEGKTEVFAVLKASLERCTKMIEGATRSSDQQVLKSLKDKDAQAELLRKRSAGLANASEDAFKANNIFSLDFAKAGHDAFPHVEIGSVKNLDSPWWIPQSEKALSIMESKGIRLNHVVCKARFTQDKSKKRDYKAFADADHSIREAFKSVLDPMHQHVFCCDGNERVNAMHCYGYHSGMTYSGPDISCAATLRLTAPKSGDRAVLCFPFMDAYNYVKSVNEQSGSSDPKMADVINVIRTISQEGLAQLPFKMFHGLFGPLTFVYQPPGFVMFEKVLGSNTVTGVVATFMPCSQQTSDNLQAFVDLTRGVSIQGIHLKC